jgi:hypothetical protein
MAFIKTGKGNTLGIVKPVSVPPQSTETPKHVGTVKSNTDQKDIAK